jgi:hypothetical protein
LSGRLRQKSGSIPGGKLGVVVGISVVVWVVGSVVVVGSGVVIGVGVVVVHPGS